MERELLWCVRSNAAETTELLGEELGRALSPGALLALVGELGSGKTTLVRGLARGLGSEAAVLSPTFTRMRVLPGRLPLYHFDAWRGGAEELFAEGNGEIGLDHYEVRSWLGWQHQVTLSLLALWFVQREKRRLGKKLPASR